MIYLRAFELNDYVLINQWRNDPEIQRLTSGCMRYVSPEMEKEWVRQKAMNNTKDIYLSICLRDDSNRMIGYTSINDIDYINRSADGGGIVIGDKNYRDGEIRFEVGKKVRELVFDNLNLNRFTGSCLVEHKTSRILMEACGFKSEGVKRQAIYKNGSYHDQEFFALLRDKYYEYLHSGGYAFVAYVGRIKCLKKEHRSNDE